MADEKQRAARWLLYLLRHGATKEGLTVWPGGWTDLTEIAWRSSRSPEFLMSVVMGEEGGRLQLLWHSGWWLRATPLYELQGWGAAPPGLEGELGGGHASRAGCADWDEWEQPPLAYHIGAA